MMYQEGHVDMLALKEILGHAHVSTTEIYTHLGSAQLKEAAKASPFAKMDFERPSAPHSKSGEMTEKADDIDTKK